MQILAISSRSPWRITVTTDTTPTQIAADYVLSRPDNGPNSIVVNSAFIIGKTTVELALSEKLIDGVNYLLTLPNASGTPSALVSYRLAAIAFIPPTTDDDPEAEAFGVDMDWLAEGLDGKGDIPQVRGRQCLINDLVAIALINPGEIFHRPTSGAGLPQRVNGPAITTEVSSMQAKLKRTWAEDGRVRQNGVSLAVSIDTTGKVTVSGTVQTVAVEDPLQVRVPGGSA